VKRFLVLAAALAALPAMAQPSPKEVEKVMQRDFRPRGQATMERVVQDGLQRVCTDTHDRLRRDRIDDSGVVTLRHNGRLHHIGIGRTHARTHVLILVHDLQIRVVDAATGELLRELVLDPTKDYQATGRPPGPVPKHPK